MEVLQIQNMTLSEFQRMLDESHKRAIKDVQIVAPVQEPNDDLTLREAAKQVHCHPTTLSRKLKTAKIKTYRKGKEIMITRANLQKFKQSAL